MTSYILMILVMVWFMMFYLGFRLIDIRHDLRAVRLHMERIGNRRIRK
jgi:hypothetical protein